MTFEMQYPLKEKIGKPGLLTGRKYEFDFINQWIDNIPKELSKSKVISSLHIELIRTY